MIGILSLLLWLFIIPLGIGAIPATLVSKQNKSPGFMWISGMILSWAMFEILSVPIILKETMGEARFPQVELGFGAVSVVLALLGAFLWCRSHAFGGKEKTMGEPVSKRMVLLWILTLLLVGIQLVMSVVMTYGDGDDAFYVAVSTITRESNTLYQLQPYSIGYTALDGRHGLAPFPIWIAFLADMSHIPAVIVAHVVVSTVLIGMTYIIFKKIGDEIFEAKWASPLFVAFSALLVMFGDYSLYTAENFMIARSRQGKAALGNIVIPMVILLFLLILRRVQEEQKTEWMLWVLLSACVAAGCLCSTLGTFLLSMFLGIVGLLAGLLYRKWELVWKTALCCAPAVIVAILYFVV